jgi:hypothetical protein
VRMSSMTHIRWNVLLDKKDRRQCRLKSSSKLSFVDSLFLSEFITQTKDRLKYEETRGIRNAVGLEKGYKLINCFAALPRQSNRLHCSPIQV